MLVSGISWTVHFSSFFLGTCCFCISNFSPQQKQRISRMHFFGGIQDHRTRSFLGQSDERLVWRRSCHFWKLPPTLFSWKTSPSWSLWRPIACPKEPETKCKVFLRFYGCWWPSFWSFLAGTKGLMTFWLFFYGKDVRKRTMGWFEFCWWSCIISSIMYLDKYIAYYNSGGYDSKIPFWTIQHNRM